MENLSKRKKEKSIKNDERNCNIKEEMKICKRTEIELKSAKGNFITDQKNKRKQSTGFDANVPVSYIFFNISII